MTTNLLDEAAYVESTHRADPWAVTRYGAFVLGHVLGHAVADDRDPGPLWPVYGSLLWPAVRDGVGGQLARVIKAAGEIGAPDTLTPA